MKETNLTNISFDNIIEGTRCNRTLVGDNKIMVKVFFSLIMALMLYSCSNNVSIVGKWELKKTIFINDSIPIFTRPVGREVFFFNANGVYINTFNDGKNVSFFNHGSWVILSKKGKQFLHLETDTSYFKMDGELQIYTDSIVAEDYDIYMIKDTILELVGDSLRLNGNRYKSLNVYIKSESDRPPENKITN